MTVASENDRRNQYIATAAQTVFAYEYLIRAATELTVKQTLAVDGTTSTLTNSADYSVSNVGVGGGGDVTLTVGAALNDRITIEGDTPGVRTSDFTPTNFKSDALNNQLDDLTIHVQELLRDRDRSAILPDQVLDSVDAALPEPVANYLLGWNATGTAIINIIDTDSTAIGGPATGGSTNNAVARWDGDTGQLLQNSIVLISDAGAITGATAVTTDALTVNVSATFNVPIAIDTANTIWVAKETDGGTASDTWFAESDTRQLNFGAIDNDLANKNNYMEVTRGAADSVIATVTFPGGVLRAGTATTVLTNADGTIVVAAIDPTGSSINDVIANVAGVLTLATLASLLVDLSTDVGVSILPDANVAENLTLSGATIDNSVIGAVTPAAATLTDLTVNTSATFNVPIAIDTASTIWIAKETDGGTVSDSWFAESAARQLNFGAINDDLTSKNNYMEVTRGAADSVIAAVTFPNGSIVIGEKLITPTAVTLASATSVAITSTNHNLTGTTQIDNMTGGVEGQVLHLFDQTAITLGYNKTGDGKIFSKSKADFTLAAFTGITFICRGTTPNTIWYEV